MFISQVSKVSISGTIEVQQLSCYSAYRIKTEIEVRSLGIVAEEECRVVLKKENINKPSSKTEKPKRRFFEKIFVKLAISTITTHLATTLTRTADIISLTHA